MTRVVNLRNEVCDIKICRPSKWGNPFVIGKDGTRKEVIKKYLIWILKQPYLMNSLHELENKTLGCFCKPKECHGDILLNLIESEKRMEYIQKWD